MTLSIKQEVVTPKLAEEWLEGSINPRKLSGTRVDMYANQMLADEWEETGEPIQFDTSGTMKNGQHRLKAIIKSGKSQRLVVIRGVQPSAVKVMDAGLARTVADYISSELGYGYSTARMAATARAILAWQAGVVHNANAMTRTITRTSIADFAVENGDRLMDAIRKADTIYRTIGGNLTSWAAAFFELTDPEFNQDQVEMFYQSMITGEGLELGNAMLATRNWFISWQVTNRKNATLPIPAGLYIVVKGWNRWINEEYTERIHGQKKSVLVPPLLPESGEVKEVLRPKVAIQRKVQRRKRDATYRSRQKISVEEVPEDVIIKTPRNRRQAAQTAE